jgi:hypothetical protein
MIYSSVALLQILDHAGKTCHARGKHPAYLALSLTNRKGFITLTTGGETMVSFPRL